MKVEFAPSFFESLKKLSKHQTWWYKTYETVRWKIPCFFKNVWRFRKELWKFRRWDSVFNIAIFRASLEQTAICIKDGNEVESSRMKKYEKIMRAVELMKAVENDDFIDRAEMELGECIHKGNIFASENLPEDDAHNRKVYDRARELEEKEWAELWQILKGQSQSDLESIMHTVDTKLADAKDEADLENRQKKWDDAFDGSGMRGWWD